MDYIIPGLKSYINVVPKQFRQEIVIRLLKVVDIGYITIFYFIFGYGFATLYDRILGKFRKDRADAKSALRIALELIGHIWSIGVVTYLVRNVVELIPSPLHGLYGFNHYKLKELTIAPVFSLVFILFQDNLREKLRYFYNRCLDKKSVPDK